MGSLVLVMVIMAMYWWRKDAKGRAKELERIRDAQQVQLALAEYKASSAYCAVRLPPVRVVWHYTLLKMLSVLSAAVIVRVQY